MDYTVALFFAFGFAAGFCWERFFISFRIVLFARDLSDKVKGFFAGLKK